MSPPSLRRLLGVLLPCLLVASSCSVHRLGDGQAVQAGQEAAPAGSPDAAVPPGQVLDPATAAPAATGAATPAAAGAAGASTAGPTGAAVGGSAPRTPVANATGTVTRRASDQGVTENEIRLGILQTSDAFFAATGSSTKDVNRVIAPFIKEINESGGINGRMVVPKVSTYDPLSADSMKAACVQQAEDYKVFSSIAQIGFYGDAEICMATKQVPLLTGNNSTRKTNVEREKGWVRQTNQNKDRNMRNWIDWMIASRLLTPQTKTGLLFVDVPEDRDLVDEVVLPYLRSKGMPAPQLATLSASIAQTPTESQAAVLRFKTDGVQLVLPLVSFLRMLIFAQQADSAQYKPNYSVSDFGLLSTDAMAGMPPSQWTGVRGITVAPTGIAPAGDPPPGPAFAECAAVYKRYGETFAPNPDDRSKADPLELAMVAHYCEHIALWADAARRAGPNPTRRSLLDAFDATGTWNHRVVLSERLTFSPTKYDGADLFAVVEWRPGCNSDGGCYRQVEGFRPGTP